MDLILCIPFYLLTCDVIYLMILFYGCHLFIGVLATSVIGNAQGRIYYYNLNMVHSTNATFSYFVVNARIKNGMEHSGYRKSIYEDAQQHCACYDVVRDPSCSIWYPDDSNDLHIKLLFLSKKEAHDFIGC